MSTTPNPSLSAGSTPSVVPSGAAETGAATPQANALAATPKGSKLQTFEGFLKRAGHLAGVLLNEVVRYAIPIASLTAVADPAAAPALQAFTSSVKMVQNAVVAIQQRWASEGSAANSQKLADVLLLVEQPITTLFAQAGVQVDTPYVTNLINGVVALLNAQPSAVLPAR